MKFAIQLFLVVCFSILTTLCRSEDGLPLGVSITSIVGDEVISPGMIQELGESKIVSFEIWHSVFTGSNATVKDDFLKMLADRGKKAISFHLPFGDDCDISLVDETKRQAAVQMQLAQLPAMLELGCEYAVIHPGNGNLAPAERAARLAAARKSLEEMAPEFQKNHVRLAVENMPYQVLGNQSAELITLTEDLQDVVGVCMDVNHTAGQVELPADMIRKLSDRLIGLHISDNDAVDEKHWMPGEGVVDFEAIFAALHEIKFQGSFNYETCIIEGRSVTERCQRLEENYDFLFEVMGKGLTKE